MLQFLEFGSVRDDRISARRRKAGVAQLVEHQLPKLRVAGSSPVSRSIVPSVRQLAGRTSRLWRMDAEGRAPDSQGGIASRLGAVSSVGLERLVYTQKVGGSNPSPPTSSDFVVICAARFVQSPGQNPLVHLSIRGVVTCRPYVARLPSRRLLVLLPNETLPRGMGPVHPRAPRRPRPRRSGRPVVMGRRQRPRESSLRSATGPQPSRSARHRPARPPAPCWMHRSCPPS